MVHLFIEHLLAKRVARQAIHHYQTGRLTIITVGNRYWPYKIITGDKGPLMSNTGIYVFNGQNLIWTNLPHLPVQIIP